MRIGLFTDQYYPNISGVVTSITMLYEGLTNLGHEVFVFTSYDEKFSDVEELKNSHVINLPGKPYPFKGLKDYRYTPHRKSLVKVIKPYNLDIIHVHTEFNIAKIAIIASKKLHIPIVHTLHTLYEDYLEYVSPFFDKYFHNIMFRTLAKMFVGTISKASIIDIVPTLKVKELAKHYYMKGDIRIVPTGIELHRFNSSNFTDTQKEDLKKRLGISKDKFIFAYVGRTSSEKNIEIIIEAYSKLSNRDNCVLLIVGGGPELENLKKVAKNYNVYNDMIFTGFIDNIDIPIYYQIVDIFVNASKSETQGLTYIESLASSLPLLVQKDDCITEVVEDYYNGIYFDGVEELKTKMEEIQKVPETLKSIKANTRKSVQKYSKEHYAKSIANIYQEAIAKYNNKKGK